MHMDQKKKVVIMKTKETIREIDKKSNLKIKSIKNANPRL